MLERLLELNQEYAEAACLAGEAAQVRPKTKATKETAGKKTASGTQVALLDNE